MEWTAPHANPLSAALECAQAHGIAPGFVGMAILTVANFNDWRISDDGAQDDILAAIAENVGIVVQQTEQGAFRACFDKN